MTVIGIDLGTTNSLVSYWEGGKARIIPNSFGDLLTPSVVSVDDNGEVYIGKIARERMISHHDSTIAAFKRFIGNEKIYMAGEKRFSSEDLSALVLKQLKEDAEKYLNKKITNAVISVPAYFNDDQRSATKLAGELAGLKVDRLINEPSAAALTHILSSQESEETLMVFDFGGGTLDISIVDIYDQMIEIIAIAGDNHLGGEDFDELIVKEFIKENKLTDKDLNNEVRAILKKRGEKAKIGLTIFDSSMMRCEIQGHSYSMVLTAEKLEDISIPLFIRMKAVIARALKDAKISLSDLGGVVMVGGSSKMPIVRNYISRITGIELFSNFDPDCIVGMGTGILCGMIQRNQAIKDIVLTDVCPFSLGVGINSSDGIDDMSIIIERNNILPCSKVKTYCTHSLGQNKIRFCIYQGEQHKVSDNLKLGDFTITVPVNYEDYETVSVRFTYDVNGILEIMATSLTTGEEITLVIVNKKARLSDEEIRKHLNELSYLKIHPKNESVNQFVLEKGKRLFVESIGDLREYIGNILGNFQDVLERQNNKEIKKYRLLSERIFDNIEESLNKSNIVWADEIKELEEDIESYCYEEDEGI